MRGTPLRRHPNHPYPTTVHPVRRARRTGSPLEPRLSAPIDDQPVFGFGAPVPAAGGGGAARPETGLAPAPVAARLDERADRSRGDENGRAGVHARPVEVPPVEAPPLRYGDRRRYFLSSLEPSGDFDAVIIAVTDGARRRYFTTRDGAELTEIDVAAFDRRNEGGERSLLELDERELGELEAELRFVRPVRGRDPIAEVREAASAVPQPTPSPGVAVDAAALAATEPHAAPDESAVQEDTEPDEPAIPDEAVPLGAVLIEDDADDEHPRVDAQPETSDAGSPTPADSFSRPEEVPPVPDAMDPAPEETTGQPVAAPGVDDQFEEIVLAARRSTFREAPHAAAEEVSPADEPEPTPDPIGVDPQPAPVTDADEPSDPVAQSTPIPTHAHTLDPAPDTTPDPLSHTVAIEQVALAKGIAFIAHRGQLDRSGMPYIDHPGRIAERFDPATEPIEAAAAWLHDVLEDTAITPEELFEAGVRPEIIEIVRLLTRSPDVAPAEYYARIRAHAAARRVKLADIDDNTARWRLRRLDYDVQLRLIEKYRLARRALGSM